MYFASLFLTRARCPRLDLEICRRPSPTTTKNRRGYLHPPRSPSRSSSADAAGGLEENRSSSERRRIGEKKAKINTADDPSDVSFPRLATRSGPDRRRRKPRHVSAFRDRILEERRARKEVTYRPVGAVGCFLVFLCLFVCLFCFDFSAVCLHGC